jgi:hypothetical protein
MGKQAILAGHGYRKILGAGRGGSNALGIECS